MPITVLPVARPAKPLPDTSKKLLESARKRRAKGRGITLDELEKEIADKIKEFRKFQERQFPKGSPKK